MGQTGTKKAPGVALGPLNAQVSVLDQQVEVSASEPLLSFDCYIQYSLSWTNRLETVTHTFISCLNYCNSFYMLLKVI